MWMLYSETCAYIHAWNGNKNLAYGSNNDEHRGGNDFVSSNNERRGGNDFVNG
jgi:hypothetical protein